MASSITASVNKMFFNFGIFFSWLNVV